MKPNQNTDTPPAAGARQYALIAALTLSLSNVGQAQTAPAADATPAKDDETIELSPFTVEATNDTGYRANNTLAGSRINTQLKDVASSITVVTKAMMDDINAVGINDILTYTANTEGTNDFTATKLTLGRPSDDSSHNSQTANRVRGLFSAAITRDYFYTISDNVGFDSYNIDSVTINRGPNSALAGLGLPGGIINYSPVAPSLFKDTSELSFRYGSYNDQRATFNTNYVAKKGVFAVKVAGAWSDVGFKQKPAWDHDKRLYAAFSYAPFKKTVITGSFERVDVKARTPNTLTPEDQITKYVEMGKPTSENDPNNWLSWNQFYGVVYNANHQPEGFREQTWSKPFRAYEAWDWSKDASGNWVYGQSPLLYTNQRLHDNKLIDLQNVNFMPSSWNQKLDAASVNVTHEIVRNLDASAGFLYEKYSSNSLDLFRPEYSVIRVDPNVKLPDGSANPHFQETYMLFRGLDNKQATDRTNRVVRAALNYHLDLKKTNKWLGVYDFTAFAEDRATESKARQWNASTSATANEEVSYLYYLGAKIGERITNTPGTPGEENALVYNKDGVAQSGTKSVTYWLKSDKRNKESLRSTAIVVTPKLLDDQIIGTLALRRDKDGGAYTGRTEGDSGAVVNGVLAPVLPYPDFTYESETTHTYGVVLAPKALKWVRFHYNRAESWMPGAGKLNLEGQSVPSPRGLGKDMGFTVTTPDDKLFVKFNWFDVSSKNGAADLANFPLAQWQLPFVDLTVMKEIAAAAGITNYKSGIADGITTGDSRIFYTAQNVSKGLEIEATYNPTKNWRIQATVSQQDSKQSNIAPDLSAFIEKRLAYYKSIPGLLDGPISNEWSVNKNGQGWVDQFIIADYAKYKAYDGQPATQLAKWHATALTNYDFDSGVLKGFNIGGGLRYIDKAIIGNAYVKNSDGSYALDYNKAYYSPSRIAADVWFGYKMKLSEKRRLSFQVNIKNIEENGGFRAITANSDGTPSAYSIVQPRTFYLTTTLDF